MLPEGERIARAAAELLEARRSGTRLRSLPAALVPGSEAEAYAIQQAQFSAMQLCIGGWKSTMFDALTGAYAPIATSALLTSPTKLSAASAPSAGSSEFGIEPEIAFRMARTVTALPTDPGERRAAVIDAIASAHAAIEIVVSRFVDPDAVSANERLADFLLNEALVVWPPCTDWRELDISRLPLQVSVAGAQLYSGRGGHPLNDPLLPVIWLAGALLEHGSALKAGEVVTTGSCNGLRKIAAGQVVSADFGPLERAQVQF